MCFSAASWTASLFRNARLHYHEQPPLRNLQTASEPVLQDTAFLDWTRSWKGNLSLCRDSKRNGVVEVAKFRDHSFPTDVQAARKTWSVWLFCCPHACSVERAHGPMVVYVSSHLATASQAWRSTWYILQCQHVDMYSDADLKQQLQEAMFSSPRRMLNLGFYQGFLGQFSIFLLLTAVIYSSLCHLGPCVFMWSLITMWLVMIKLVQSETIENTCQSTELTSPKLSRAQFAQAKSIRLLLKCKRIRRLF